jgi:hypothetical protein
MQQQVNSFQKAHWPDLMHFESELVSRETGFVGLDGRKSLGQENKDHPRSILSWKKSDWSLLHRSYLSFQDERCKWCFKEWRRLCHEHVEGEWTRNIVVKLNPPRATHERCGCHHRQICTVAPHCRCDRRLFSQPQTLDHHTNNDILKFVMDAQRTLWSRCSSINEVATNRSFISFIHQISPLSPSHQELSRN